MSECLHDEYGGAFPEIYDQTPGYYDRADMGFYLARAAGADGRVLELGCGTGRVTIPVARAGREIVGVDLSEGMLARCRAKLAAESPDVRSRVRLIHGDMANVRLDGEFALVLSPFRAFQHLLRAEDQMACLGNIREHIAPRGRLILDLFHTSPSALARSAQGEPTADFTDLPISGDRTLTRSYRSTNHRRAEQLIHAELFYDVTDASGATDRITHAFDLRYPYRWEMEHLLARCGFRVVEVLGGFDGEPFADDSPELLLVAEPTDEDDAHRAKASTRPPTSYAEPAAGHYDTVVGRRERGDAAFYVERAREAGGPVLELGCGTGRVTIPMARAGSEVLGLDLSGAMLDRCRERVREEPPEVQGRVRLIEGSMASFTFPERFRLILTPALTFQHLTRTEDQFTCLRSVREHLADDGRFILELFHPDPARLAAIPEAEGRVEMADVPLPGGARLTRSIRMIDHRRSLQTFRSEETHEVVYPDGRVERLVQTLDLRYVHRWEAEHLLARMGFRVLEVIGDFTGAPFGDASPMMILVAGRA